MRATGLPDDAWSEIQVRAEAAGLRVALSTDRSTLEVVATVA